MARSNTVDILFRLKDEVSKKLADMDTAVNKFGNNLKNVFTSSVRSSLPAELDFIADGLDKIPLGATAAAGALIGIGKAAIDMAEDVERSALAYDKLSQKTGASVEFLSGFTAACISAMAGPSARRGVLSARLAASPNSPITASAARR
jgi:hypothetical protein